MVEIIGASNASVFAVQGRNIIGRLVNVPSPGTRLPTTLALPKGTVLSLSRKGELSLNLRDVRGALDLAIRAGGAVINTLKILKKFTDIAANGPLVSNEAGVVVGGGNRLSRSNLSSQARLALRRLNDLIEKSNLAGANFISSSGRTVSVVTSSFGGKIAIKPQPLDTVGLGLDDFSLVFQADVDKAISSISEAIIIAELRVQRLEALRNALSNPDPFNANLARVISNGQAATLPRGSLVNVVG